MKKFVKMFITVISIVALTSCGNQYATINGGGGGGGGSYTVRHSSPKVRSASEVFGNQPMNPTPDAVNSTWGATMGSEYWWNDARKGDRALLQHTSPGEPVLVSRSTGFVWRKGCYNRVAPAEESTEEVVTESGGGNSIVQNGATFQAEINISAEQEGYYNPRPMIRNNFMRPQVRYQRYCPPPRPVMHYQPRPCPPPRQMRPCPPRPCPPGMHRRY